MVNWLVQRVTSVILAGYCWLLLCSWWLHLNWQNLFSQALIKNATFFTLLALIIHAWLGIWTVTTDYLKTTSLRLFMQILVLLMLLFYLAWGAEILWG